jgi:hypothetical protein
MNIDDNDAIAACEIYKGSPIFDQQSPDRIREVRRELDRVHATSSAAALCEWCANARNSPESRLFSLAKLRILAAEGADARRPLGVDLELAEAHCAGLGVRRWRSPTHYGSTLNQRGCRLRETPLDEGDV